ncbi:MAG: hypothetical protein WD066_12925 [Planctomycetaceae bacterium]
MEYQLKAIGKNCAATGEPLAAGGTCYSALVHRGGQIVRLDFAEEAWGGPPEGTIGFWKTVVPVAETGKKKPLDPDALMRHFEQLTEEAQPSSEKLRYVLAILLLQKRRLELEGTRSDGDDQWLRLVGARGEGNFEIRDQQLEGDELEQLQNSLDVDFAPATS